MNLIQEFKACLSKSDIYGKPEENKPSRAIRYMALLLIVTSALSALIVASLSVPAMKGFRDSSLAALEKYPADLTLTLSKGTLSMSRPSPYAISAAEFGFKSPLYENVAVIDTSKDLDFKDFAPYKTASLIARDGYMYVDKNGTYKVNMFARYPDMTIDKAKVELVAQKIGFLSSFIYVWALLIGLLAFVGIYIMSFIVALLFALVGTLATLVITRAKGYRLDFKQLYALSLYAYTVAVVIALLGYVIPFTGWISIAAFIAILVAFVEPAAPAKADPTTV